MKNPFKLTYHMIFFAAVTLVMIAVIRFGLNSHIDYSPQNSNGITFVKGKVKTIDSENIETDENGIKRGTQQLTVELLEGSRKGEEINVNNPLVIGHSIYAKIGQTLVICLDQPQDDYYYATVQSYDRLPSICIIVSVFVLSLVAIGKKTGLRSAFGLIFTFVMIIFLLLPLVAKGGQPFFLSVGVVISIIIVSLTAMMGFSKKNLITILGTSMGVVLCCILFFIMSYMLKISGYNVDEIETLIVIAQNTNIQIKDLLFVGVLIASLGGIMDVAVSITSSIAELCELDPKASFSVTFSSGLRIASDIIGANANTLILAFTGTFFIMLFLFRIYNIQFNQLISMDSIAIEIAQAMSASMALIFTAPITAFIAARFYSGGKKI